MIEMLITPRGKVPRYLRTREVFSVQSKSGDAVLAKHIRRPGLLSVFCDLDDDLLATDTTYVSRSLTREKNER